MIRRRVAGAVVPMWVLNPPCDVRKYVEAVLAVEIAKINRSDCHWIGKHRDNPEVSLDCLGTHDDDVKRVAVQIARLINPHFAWLTEQVASVHDIGKDCFFLRGLHRKVGQFKWHERFMKRWHGLVGQFKLWCASSAITESAVREVIRLIGLGVRDHHDPCRSGNSLVEEVALYVMCADMVVAAMEDRKEGAARKRRTQHQAIQELRVELSKPQYDVFGELNGKILAAMAGIHLRYAESSEGEDLIIAHVSSLSAIDLSSAVVQSGVMVATGA